MTNDSDLIDLYIDMALKIGPHVFEAWTCEHCGVEAFQFHRFEEVINCAKCGHRTASKVPLYKFAMEKAATEA
jgi:ribosomal protein L37E